jgi:hypothetical protein
MRLQENTATEKNDRNLPDRSAQAFELAQVGVVVNNNNSNNKRVGLLCSAQAFELAQVGVLVEQ